MDSIANNIKRIKSLLPLSVKLVAVSKFHPAQMIEQAYDAGQRMFGESRPQEFSEKVAYFQKYGYNDIEWHFIGHLQTNKLKMVLPHVSMVHSVDSLKLLQAINEWGEANGKVIDVLLEMHIAQETSKQGFSEKEIRKILYGPFEYSNVHFCGLMGMATFSDEESVIRTDFSKIKALFDEIHEEAISDASFVKWRLTHFKELSIGMSNDYRLALSHGATIVRIGTDIFGDRY